MRLAPVGFASDCSANFAAVLPIQCDQMASRSLGYYNKEKWPYHKFLMPKKVNILPNAK